MRVSFLQRNVEILELRISYYLQSTRIRRKKPMSNLSCTSEMMLPASLVRSSHQLNWFHVEIHWTKSFDHRFYRILSLHVVAFDPFRLVSRLDRLPVRSHEFSLPERNEISSLSDRCFREHTKTNVSTMKMCLSTSFVNLFHSNLSRMISSFSFWKIIHTLT